MDPANNLSRYRNVLARVGKREPCIPFFGEIVSIVLPIVQTTDGANYPFDMLLL